jgi:hypothetical protein
MKLLISTVVAFVLFFLLGWLFYGVIFVNHLSSMKVIMRPESDMKMWAIMVGHLLQGLFLSILYMKTYKGENPLKEGVIYASLITMLMTFPYVFYMWGAYLPKYKAVLADGAGMAVRIFVVCIVIAFIFGKKKIAKTD